MTPIELKQWQAALGLSELAMAAYLGVPVHTLKGWTNGTRILSAAPLRLVRVLQLVQDSAKQLHIELIGDAVNSEPAKRQAGRPAGSRNRAKADPRMTASEVLANQVSPAPQGVPSWLSGAL